MSKISSLFTNFLKSPMKLKLSFAFIFITFAILIASISFIVNYNYENKYIKNEIHDKAISFIKEKNIYLKQHIDRHRHTLNSISHNKIFKNYIQNKKSKIAVTSLFEHIIASDQNIMQIRYIDKDGMENVRLDRSEKNLSYTILENVILQDKKDRYYFQEVSKMGKKNGVWISKIDLNIENGKIQTPYVPTVRLAVPIYQDAKFEGIVILNIFMKDILNNMTSSSLFTVSLIDGNGDFLIGKAEIDGTLYDFSWSKYLLKKIDLESFAPNYIQQILTSHEFDSEHYHSKKISTSVGLNEDITMVLKIKDEKVEELYEKTIHKILDTLGIVLLISGPIGFLLAYIPSFLATKVYDSSTKLEEKTLLFDEYLEAMNVNNIISKSDLKGRITYVNKNFCDVSGYTEEEVIGKQHSLLRDPNEPKETFQILWLTIQSGKTWKGILRNIKKDGGYYDIDIAIMPIFDRNHNIIEYLAIRHDITELIEQRKNLIAIATKDPLVNIGNRYKLTLDIKKHLVNNIAVIDIDKFSSINDFYGHNIGNDVIIKFSQLIENNITDEFELYRLHSDKFAILNYTLDNNRFTNFITNLNVTLTESIINTEVEEFSIVTTAGISSCDNETVLLTAEIANKHAKKINKKLLVYSKELNIEKEFEQNIIWTHKIQKALREDKIILHYQPLFNNETKKIEKYEALVRLIDEDGSIISPYFFLNIAKSSGQYIDITKIVILKSFQKFRNENVQFSINLTVEDILDDELSNYLEEMIEKYNVASKLVIELVESEGIEEFEIVQKFIKKLKFLGCKIAIDDFGTGYSNFEYLVKLDADYIKIDGSMIKNINNDPNMKEIVKTIINFSKKMNYKIIAEFVETKEIQKTVEELNINYSQGYYIGKPDENLIS